MIFSVVYLLTRCLLSCLLMLGRREASKDAELLVLPHGTAPAPHRAGPNWKQFPTAQGRGILAAGFMHVDTVLLRRIYTLIVIEHGTRRACLACVTASPDGASVHAARNFLTDFGQRMASMKFLTRDRAAHFTESFDAVFTGQVIRVLASPPQAPRASAIRERMIGTLRPEIPDRLLIVNEHRLRHVLTEYLQHYNAARPHRGLSQLPPARAQIQPLKIDLAQRRIRGRRVLGGLTDDYQVAA